MLKRIASAAGSRALGVVPGRERLWLQMSAQQTFGKGVLEGRLPLSVRLQAFKLGFFAPHYVVYGLDRGLNDVRGYVNDRTWCNKTLKLNGTAQRYLDDKLAWFVLLEAIAPTTQPPLHGMVVDGAYVSRTTTPLAELVESQEGLVFKPVRGSRGRGVSIVRRTPDGVTLDGRAATTAEVLAKTARMTDFIVSGRIVQHPYAEALYPPTTNTLRVLALRDHDTKEAFIAGAVQRIGTRRSGHVDNWSQGGVNARVDVQTGVLGRAVQYPYDGKLVWHTHHPDTGAPIQGVTVAKWNDVQQLVLSLMRAVPSLRNVGWDIAVTAGGPQVIEGNGGPDVRTLQVHDGLLLDERTRRFYEGLR